MLKESPVTKVYTPFRMVRRLRYPEAVFLDWDLTLCHTKLLTEQLKEESIVARYAGQSRPAEVNMGNDLPTGSLIKDRLMCLYEGDAAKARAAYDEYTTRYPVRLKEYKDAGKTYLYEGVEETINMLLDANVPVAIVSNTTQKALEQSVDIMLGKKISDRLVKVGTFWEDKAKLHNVALARRAERELGIRGSKAVYMVGDRKGDLIFGENAGYTKVLFGDEIMNEITDDFNKDRELPEAMHAYAVASDHKELQALFRKALAGPALGTGMEVNG